MTGATPPEVWRDFFDTPERDVLLAEGDIVVIRDRTPKASQHLLVLPRYEPLSGTEALRPVHLPLLARMRAAGERVMAEQAKQGGRGEALVLGFHRKPLRSVDHLHLHVLRPPFGPGKKIKFVEPPKFLPMAFIAFGSLVENLKQKEEKNKCRARL